MKVPSSNENKRVAKLLPPTSSRLATETMVRLEQSSLRRTAILHHHAEEKEDYKNDDDLDQPWDEMESLSRDTTGLKPYQYNPFMILSCCSLATLSSRRFCGWMVVSFLIVTTWSRMVLLRDGGLETQNNESVAISKVTFRKEDFPIVEPSPYEEETAQRLPSWARKPFFLQSSDRSAKLPSICLVHVGKTAGSTIACLLGFEYDCGETHRIQGDVLPLATKHLIHNDIIDCARDTTDYYLFTLRDPLERMKSWFRDERPIQSFDKNYATKKQLFVDCPFATLNDLAVLGLGQNSKIDRVCHERAWKAITGSVGYANYNYYNYGYFRNIVPRKALILAIRSEHIEEDWNSIESMLTTGGDGALGSAQTIPSEPVTFPRFNTSPPQPIEVAGDGTSVTQEATLSSEARKLLCKALCHEIDIYSKILRKAVNLSPRQVQESLDQLAQNCPSQFHQKKLICPGRA